MGRKKRVSQTIRMPYHCLPSSTITSVSSTVSMASVGTHRASISSTRGTQCLRRLTSATQSHYRDERTRSTLGETAECHTVLYCLQLLLLLQCYYPPLVLALGSLTVRIRLLCSSYRLWAFFLLASLIDKRHFGVKMKKKSKEPNMYIYIYINRKELKRR